MTRLATTPAILGILVGGMLAASLAAGCGGNKVEIGSQNVDAQASAPDAAAGRDAPAGGNGGSATGGATGGVVGAGGVAPTGGTVGAGGAVGTGGVAATGGTVGAGGISPAGGTIGSGGTVAAGGATRTGGATPTGGTTPSGGSMDSGGATRTGGAAASGGATRTGGLAGTGGTGGVTGTGGTGGSTGKICGPMLDGVCANGEICNGPPGACNLTGWTGTCMVKPQGCTADWQPVCGCDGKTYSNDCTRLVAGVSRKNFDGACLTTDAGADGSTGKTCGGFAGVSCPTNQFCDIAVGLCNSPDAAGTCVLNVGVGCITSVQPVCGCNGKTYNNDCERQVAGVSKRSDGACPTADAAQDVGPSVDGSSPSALCTATGGQVSSTLCCNSVSDFPNSCLGGACGCAPASSHTVSTCSCGAGCFLPGYGCAGPAGACTVGADQTCNDNPALSSIHGRCVADGRCVCAPGALLASGKCQ